jgi:poly-gamma-glutamate capsule biosynthesis protein CapA/YwtB (metallophosphatase superfamily)
MLYESETGAFNIALAGDCMPTRRLSVFREDRYLRLRDIFREADVGFANLESTVHKFLEGHHNLSEGTYITTEPSLLEEIKWFGINAVSCAGSHSFDYGEEGILRTMKYLDQAGIVHAGTGRNLRESRSPAYLDTPRGRAGFVAATAHLSEWVAAGEQRPDTSGRPGVNPLRYSTTYHVDEQGMRDLRRLGAALGVESAKERKKNLGVPTRPDTADLYEFLGNKFVTGETFSIQTTAHKQDLMENIKQVREAKGMADWVGVSLHYHEMGGPNLLTARVRSEIEEPADFVREFAHQCVDEGADVFIGHGPQVPLGIEIYKGKPVFYSLGSFVFQLETIRYLPQEAYDRYGLDHMATPVDFVKARYQNDTVGHPADPLQWQQICAVCHYRAGMVKEIALYPLDLGHGRPRSQRGRPLIADEELGEKIIGRVARLSRRLGTEVSFAKGQGLIILA